MNTGHDVILRSKVSSSWGNDCSRRGVQTPSLALSISYRDNDPYRLWNSVGSSKQKWVTV